jgi:kynurenine formamidase
MVTETTDAPQYTNWGRWGEDDQRGSANQIEAGEIIRAAGLVKQGRAIPLGLPLKTGVPISHTRTPPTHLMMISGADFAAGTKIAGGLFQAADDYLAMATAAGTHVDALSHFWYDDKLYNGHPGTSIRSSGARRLGIENLPSLIGRGVLLDVPALHGVDHLEPAHPVSSDELATCAARIGVDVGKGDIVLVRTGWHQVYFTDRDEYYRSAPGINLDGARWLAERDVAAVGSDNTAVEVKPPNPHGGHSEFEGGSPGPVSHRLLIRDCGIYLIELLDLEELAAAGGTEFLFVMAPLRIVGGVNSPVNPIAVL